MKQSVFEKFPVLQQVPKNRFPYHVCIIPDGNGRWAQQRHKFVLQGHKKAAEGIKVMLRDLAEIEEIKIVTLWGFSADNWKRSQREIQGLFKLIGYQVATTIEEVKERGSRFVHLGRKDRLPDSLLHVIEQAENETRNNKGQIICLAIDFGGEDQELRILEQVKSLPKNTKVDEQLLWNLRDCHGLIPPADLLIRTSGEKRTSDIGWLNGAQTELYFIEKYSPDITSSDIVDALVDFSKRERRFGGRIRASMNDSNEHE